MTTPHEPAETPTPRTDAAVFNLAEHGDHRDIYVDADFSRQLERENEELRKSLELFTAPLLLDSIDDIERDYGFATAQQHKAARSILARANRQGGA